MNLRETRWGLLQLVSLVSLPGCFAPHNTSDGVFLFGIPTRVKSLMQFVHPGFVNSEESYTNNAIDTEEVKELRKALL